MIGIIDYNMGNVGSIKRKLDLLNIDSLISSSVTELGEVDKLILPGVGNFSQGVKELEKLGLWDFLNSAVLEKKIPILGLCLGMQLMGKYSEEGGLKGFGWLEFEVVKFRIANKIKYKVPHIGWNQIQIMKESQLFRNMIQNPEFYFIHSYHAITINASDILVETDYEYPFVSGIERGNIFGLQFHPEKSHEFGDCIFINFENIETKNNAQA